MSDRDRAAVDIQDVVRDTEFVAAIENLHGTRFVQLPKVDVVLFEPCAFEQFWYGEHGTDTHLIRLATCNRSAAVYAQGFEAAFLCDARLHDDDGSEPSAPS